MNPVYLNYPLSLVQVTLIGSRLEGMLLQQVGNNRTPLVPDLQGLCLIENIAKRPMGVCEPWGVSNHITSGSGTGGTEDYMMKVIFHTEDYTSILFPFMLI